MVFEEEKTMILFNTNARRNIKQKRFMSVNTHFSLSESFTRIKNAASQFFWTPGVSLSVTTWSQKLSTVVEVRVKREKVPIGANLLVVR